MVMGFLAKGAGSPVRYGIFVDANFVL